MTGSGAVLCEITDVVDAVYRLLESGRAEISVAIQREAPELELRHVLDYYCELDRGQMPAIMIQPRSDQFKWWSMPTMADQTPQLEIWGVIHYDQERARSRALQRMGTAVCSILNRRHLPIDIPGGSLFFNEKTPIAGIEYGRAMFRNVLVEAFVATFACDVTVQLPDQGQHAGNPAVMNPL